MTGKMIKASSKKQLQGFSKRLSKDKKTLSAPVKAADEYIKNLEKLEKNKETNIDIVAGLTGDMLERYFCMEMR